MTTCPVLSRWIVVRKSATSHGCYRNCRSAAFNSQMDTIETETKRLEEGKTERGWSSCIYVCVKPFRFKLNSISWELVGTLCCIFKQNSRSYTTHLIQPNENVFSLSLSLYLYHLVTCFPSISLSSLHLDCVLWMVSVLLLLIEEPEHSLFVASLISDSVIKTEQTAVGRSYLDV